MFSLNRSKILAGIAENWLAKVLSIALAIILFAFHRMGSLEDRFFSVPLNVELSSTLTPASSYTRIGGSPSGGTPRAFIPSWKMILKPTSI
jgi:hypothetical protein